ncbi:unnamed protein product [Owenia fusiformis]|uniref:Uncharacterized protein n=1 Tax=Owenia fusiformis TaxID=6347 RepID=A0A8J1U085_OWEFU|nr:unnamed protein product [Owenia fusiformis]
MAVTDYIIVLCHGYLLLVIIGTMMNAVVIVVMTNKELRQFSVCIYILALSFIDILYLWFHYLRLWLEGNKIIVEISHGYCKFSQFFSATCTNISCCIMVAIALERLVSVTSALLRRKYFTHGKVKFITFCICFVIYCLDSYWLIYTHAIKDGDSWQCSIAKSPASHTIHTTCTYFIGYSPIAIVLCLNIAIFVRLQYQYRGLFVIRQQASLDQVTQLQQKNRRIIDRQLTIMLCSSSLMFIITTTPNAIYGIIHHANFNNQPSLIYNIVTFTAGLNYSVKFLIYLYFGRSFRLKFLDMSHLRSKKRSDCPHIESQNMEMARRDIVHPQVNSILTTRLVANGIESSVLPS